MTHRDQTPTSTPARRATVLGVLAVLALLWPGWTSTQTQAPQTQTLPTQAPPTTPPAAPAPTGSPASPSAPSLTPATPPGLSVVPAGGIATGHAMAVIRIEGVIDNFAADSLKRRCESAMDQGATLLVIELDTPGGRVDSAFTISQYLKALPAGIDTVAWVNDQAYSAGILIAAACDQIVMSPASYTGNCAPIMPGKSLNATERAKAYAPIRSEFEDSARRHDYNPALFDAMCRLGVELYLVEHRNTGERKIVNQADYAIMVLGQKPDTGFASGPGGTAPSTTANPEAAFKKVGPQVAGTAADLGAWQAVTTLPSGATLPDGRLHDGGGLFTPSQTVAQDIGLSKATLATPADIGSHYGAASVVTVSMSWSERIVEILVHPITRGVLVLILVVSGFLAFASPGTGIPEIVAVSALAILFGAPFMVGLAEFWHLLIFIVGLGMLIAEFTLTPAFGVLGVMGIISMLVGLVMAAVPAFTQSSGSGPAYANPKAIDALILNISAILSAGVVGLISIAVLSQYFRQLPIMRRMILEQPVDLPVEPGSPEAQRRMTAGIESLGGGTLDVGDTGRVTTGLHPAGRARFPGHDAEIDVVSEGGFIDPGTKIRITELAGSRIVVETV